MGDADESHISMSHVDRQNLRIHMAMRQSTRLTNAFSTEVYNLSLATAMYVYHHNQDRPLSTLTKQPGKRPSIPAIAVGLSEDP